MPTTSTSPAPTTHAADVRSREGLMRALDRIEIEGWDGPTGGAVLRYAMRTVVGPAVRRLGVFDSAAESAEACGWAAAWEALRTPSLRDAASPWGIVTAAVRRAVLGEHLAESYGTGVRAAWQIRRIRTRAAQGHGVSRRDWHRVADSAALSRPLSLTALHDVGWEPRASGLADGEPCPRLELLTALLVRHGWDEKTARAAIRHVAEFARPNPAGRPKAHGWREMSMELGVPHWQARRITVLLLGTPQWPGLVERLEVGGTVALEGPVIDAAVRATCDQTMRPPARAAQGLEASPRAITALAS